MNNELEELLGNKKTTTPTHRGEARMQASTPPRQSQSFIKDIVNAPISSAMAFAFVLLAAGTVVAGTFQLAPETDLQVALSTPLTVAKGPSHTEVLGVADNASGGVFADLVVNGSDDDSTVVKGTAVTVSWTTQGTKACRLSPLGLSTLQGKGLSAPLTKTTTFTLSCEGKTAPVTDSITVSVGTK